MGISVLYSQEFKMAIMKTAIMDDLTAFLSEKTKFTEE